MSEKLEKVFKDPGAAYRGKPFWSWNGKLEKDELIRQAKTMKDMGFGGFFMHSRTGLATEYLGDEWFELTNAVADAAEEIGMEAWLYDEDRWPSGCAGGIVTKNHDLRMKFMRMDLVPVEKFDTDSRTLGCYGVKLDSDGVTLLDYKLVHNRGDAEGYDTVMVVNMEVAGNGPGCNNYSYLDTMNKEAVAAFIESTHEKYREKCGARLGTSIKGIFTDEPHRGELMNAFPPEDPKHAVVPYSYNLFGHFTKKYGYDLIDCLPELFFRYKGEKINQPTWHYMELLQELFCDNFIQQIEDWCNEHNMIFTGHFLHENSLANQFAVFGSLMRGYEIMSWPGVDHLTEFNYCWNIVKQLSSVAHQTGKKWLLSELYGCTGWQFNFESHKNVGSWQALFGITLRCPHLAWYTMQGEAKRDYPASISYQSAWYDEYKHVEDYFARFAAIVANTKPSSNVLYFTPIETAMSMVYLKWGRGLDATDPDIVALEGHYRTITDWMYNAQIDFDFGDEDICARRAATVEKDGKTFLRVGEALYDTVLVSGMGTMRETTYTMLSDFMAKGGKVVLSGDAPTHIDAKEDSRAKEALLAKAECVAFDKDAVISALRADDAVVKIDEKGIFLQVRKDDKGRMFVMALNPVSNVKEDKDITLTIKKTGYVSRWDVESGNRYAVMKDTDGVIVYKTHLVAGQELVLCISEEAEELLAEPVYEIEDTITLDNIVSYELSEENMLMLDMVEHKINDGQWQERMEVLQADRAVRRAFDLPYRGGGMVQPWCVALREVPVKGSVSLRYSFSVADMPEGDVFLCMETPNLFDVRVNGKKLDTSKDEGMWVDNAFRRIRLQQSMLNIGKNEIVASVAFTEEVNLEAMYLVGNFGVSVDGCLSTVTKLPEKLSIGNLTDQGLPFYGGKVKMTFDVPKAKCAMVETEGIDAACIVVNPGQENEGFVAWKPYRSVIENVDGKLTLEVVLTRRNTFGPLHQYPLNWGHYIPDNFLLTGDNYKDDYNLYPCGLLTAPKLHILK